MAAAVLLTVGVAGGWWAGRSAAATEAARIESTLASMRTQITQDFTNALLVTQETADHAQQDEVKRVALFLRNDYRALLAGLESRLDNLSTRVNVTEEQGLHNSMAEANFEKTEE